MNTAILEKLTKAAGDVCCLAAIAEDLACEVDSGDIGRAHMLAAVVRAVLVQARALHKQADDQWLAAHRVEQGGAA